MIDFKPPKKRRGRKGYDRDIRENVIAAALAVIETEGLDGMKARTIAGQAAISVGSVYNLFGDLDGLIRIVNGRTYDELFDAVMAKLKPARAMDANPRTQMLVLAASYLEFVAAHETRWRAVLAFNRARQEQPPEWYMQKEWALLQIIEDTIAPLAGARNPDTRTQIARALWASIHGIVTVSLADGFHMQSPEAVTEQTNIIINAVASSLEGNN